MPRSKSRRPARLSRFEKRTALVSGAASGIGRATAKALAAEGAFVFCADKNLDGTRRTAGQAGSRAVAVELNVADEASWETAIRGILSRRGKLDVLVNCAGISEAGKVSEVRLEDWRRVLAVNLDGAFLGIKHGIRAMRDSGGAIVNVSSASGLRPAPGAAAYSVSKAALCMLSRTAAKECRDANLPIRVNTVCPGGVKTPMWSSMPFFRELAKKAGSTGKAFESLAAGVPGGRFSEPEDIAGAILFLASDEAGFITGVDLISDGGFVL